MRTTRTAVAGRAPHWRPCSPPPAPRPPTRHVDGHVLDRPVRRGQAHRGADRGRCARPVQARAQIEARIDRALKRLNGPATELGSVARLQQRVDNAKTAGHTAIETYLNNRLTFRKSLIPMLTQRNTDLDAVRTWCGTTTTATRARTAGPPSDAGARALFALLPAGLLAAVLSPAAAATATTPRSPRVQRHRQQLAGAGRLRTRPPAEARRRRRLGGLRGRVRRRQRQVRSA